MAQEVSWSLLAIHWNQGSACPSMEKEARVRRSDSGVAWYSKNCVILKIHPRRSEPSNRGISCFRRGPWRVGEGWGGDVEWDGEWGWVSRVAIFCKSSSNFKDMEFWVAVRENWLEVSREMASSILIMLVFERVESAMTTRAPSC